MTKSFNGNYITEYREKNNLTQAKFADKFNAYLKEHGIDGTYSNKAISMWENGNREPQNLDVTKALAEFIGVSIEALCNTAETVSVCFRRTYRNPENKFFSDELKEFVFGVTKFFDNENIKSSFWTFVPIDINLLSDFDPGALDLDYESVFDIKRELKDAKIINQYELNDYLCDYVIENKSFIKDGQMLSRFLFNRFNPESLREIYETFLYDDANNYADEYGYNVEISIDCKVIDAIYTTAGLLIRIETSAEMPEEIFNQMHREFCNEIGFERVSDISVKNNKTADFWL